jgi:hypothetical protein
MNNFSAKFAFVRNAEAKSLAHSSRAARDALLLFRPKNSDALHAFIKKAARQFILDPKISVNRHINCFFPSFLYPKSIY